MGALTSIKAKTQLQYRHSGFTEIDEHEVFFVLFFKVCNFVPRTREGRMKQKAK